MPNDVTLNKMYPTREKRLKFMEKCALTFGMRLDLLSEILGEDKDVLYREYQKDDIYHASSLNFLFYHGFKPQEQARQDFFEYFTRLKAAFFKRDIKKCQEILKELTELDAKVMKFKNNRNLGDNISEEDVLNILKFQLKYGLASKIVALFVGIDASLYSKKVNALQDEYPNLISEYHYVADFWSNVRNKRRKS